MALKRERSSIVKTLKGTKGQIVEDSSYIHSLKSQLDGVDAQVKESVLLVVANFKKFVEYQSKLNQVFISGGKSLREKYQEACLDLAPLDKLIRRNFGSGSSNRVTSAPDVQNGPEKAVAKVEQPVLEEKVSPSQAAVLDGALEKSSCKGSS